MHFHALCQKKRADSTRLHIRAITGRSYAIAIRRAPSATYSTRTLVPDHSSSSSRRAAADRPQARFGQRFMRTTSESIPSNTCSFPSITEQARLETHTTYCCAREGPKKAARESYAGGYTGREIVTQTSSGREQTGFPRTTNI